MAFDVIRFYFTFTVFLLYTLPLIFLHCKAPLSIFCRGRYTNLITGLIDGINAHYLAIFIFKTRYSLCMHAVLAGKSCLLETKFVVS